MKRVRIISREIPDPLRHIYRALLVASPLCFVIAVVLVPSIPTPAESRWFKLELVGAAACAVAAVIIRYFLRKRREWRKVADDDALGFSVMREPTDKSG